MNESYHRDIQNKNVGSNKERWAKDYSRCEKTKQATWNSANGLLLKYIKWQIIEKVMLAKNVNNVGIKCSSNFASLRRSSAFTIPEKSHNGAQ